MSFRISFTLNRKTYIAQVTEETTFGSILWVLEIDNGSTYLFTKGPRGWQCAELSKDTCKIVGRAIDEQLEILQDHH